MRSFKSSLLFILFFSALAGDQCFSQGSKDTLVSTKIIELTTVWDKYNKLSDKDFSFTDLKTASAFFDRTAMINDTSYYNYLLAYRDASINAVKDDYGFKAVANVSNNLSAPVVADDNIIYRTRVQAGIDWDILKEGYYATKVHAEKLQNEYLINKLEHEKETKVNLFVDKYAHILYLYNLQKIKVLEKRKEINTQKLALAKELNHLHEIPYIQVIQVDQSLTDIDGMFMVYKSYNDLVTKKINANELPNDPYPLVDIDFQKLAAQVMKLEEGRKDQDSIIGLKIKNLELENKPVNFITLTAQAKYNYYYVDQAIGSRDFFSLGLGFSMPIPMGKKNNMKVIDAEKQLLEYEAQSLLDQDAYEELLNTLYEYRYKLKQYMNYEEKRVRYRELLRIERVKEQFADEEFNPLAALNLLDEQLAGNVEMLDIQQQMYLSLLKIENKYPGLKIADCLKPFEMPSFGPEEKLMNKSIYVWSAAFDDYTNNFIGEFVVLNHISNVIISVKRDKSTATRTASLVDTLAHRGVKCELMTGNNKLINEDVKMFLDSLVSGFDLKNITGIHLDVEPHTFKDYKGKEQKYMDAYVKMLKDASAFCKSKKLTLNVSIPLFYPEDVLKEVYAVCDKVYLMAYERPDADFIEKKVAEEFAIGKDKTVIALRAEDFSTKEEMEAFITKLSDKLKIDRFALHDLSRIVELDQKK